MEIAAPFARSREGVYQNGYGDPALAVKAFTKPRTAYLGREMVPGLLAAGKAGEPQGDTPWS